MEGTSVLAGSGDTFPSILGCGAVDPGDAMIAIGTTGLLTLTLRPLVESVMGPHFDDGSGRASVRWAANVLSAGQLASWWAGQYDPDPIQGMARLEAEAAHISPGAEGLTALPHLLGRRTPLPNPDLRGALLGLTPRHSAAHIYRALLEAFAFNLLQGFEPIRRITIRVVVTGGGAASPLWRQILADVLGAEIGYDAQSSGALGMAYLAAWASGAVHEFDTVKLSWLRAETWSRPDPQAAAAYQAAYRSYQVFERALEQAYSQLGS
jgi:xylulokinase